MLYNNISSELELFHEYLSCVFISSLPLPLYCHIYRQYFYLIVSVSTNTYSFHHYHHFLYHLLLSVPQTYRCHVLLHQDLPRSPPSSSQHHYPAAGRCLRCRGSCASLPPSPCAECQRTGTPDSGDDQEAATTQGLSQCSSSSTGHYQGNRGVPCLNSARSMLP